MKALFKMKGDLVSVSRSCYPECAFIVKNSEIKIRPGQGFLNIRYLGPLKLRYTVFCCDNIYGNKIYNFHECLVLGMIWCIDNFVFSLKTCLQFLRCIGNIWGKWVYHIPQTPLTGLERSSLIHLSR